MLEQATVPVVSSSEVEARPGKYFMVDVRTPAEFGEVHIPGSVNVPLADLGRFASELKAWAAGKEVVLICRTGKRATSAFEQLHSERLPDCHVLAGGISAWIETGLPVNRGRQAVSMERQVRMVAGLLVAIGSTLAAAVSPWFLLIPGFVGMGLVVAGITDTCAMGMLLERLPWNRAPRCSTGAAVYSPRSPEETGR